MKRLFLLIAFVLGAGLAHAEETEAFDIAGDVYRAGTRVVQADDAEDLFMAGETVRMTGAVSGSAHMAGRNVEISGDVGENLYAAGMEVTSLGAVSGDASLAGYEVQVGAVAGDLRASGATVIVDGPIGGYALLAGETVEVNGAITGDLHLAAEDVVFGDAAKVAGQLVLYEEEPGTVEVPGSVAPDARIERRDVSDWGHDMAEYRKVSWWSMLGSFVMGLVLITALAALVAALVPEKLADMRARILREPSRALWFGFVLLSAIIGSAVLFFMTVIGIFLSPAMLFLAGLAAFAGYVVGVYAFGVWLMQAAGRPLPTELGDRVIAAAAGAFAAGILTLVPFLGWLFAMALAIVGVGAVGLHILRPRFFVGAS